LTEGRGLGDSSFSVCSTDSVRHARLRRGRGISRSRSVPPARGGRSRGRYPSGGAGGFHPGSRGAAPSRGMSPPSWVIGRGLPAPIGWGSNEEAAPRARACHPPSSGTANLLACRALFGEPGRRSPPSGVSARWQAPHAPSQSQVLDGSGNDLQPFQSGAPRPFDRRARTRNRRRARAARSSRSDPWHLFAPRMTAGPVQADKPPLCQAISSPTFRPVQPPPGALTPFYNRRSRHAYPSRNHLSEGRFRSPAAP
jgi:hypothetical protein